MSKGSKYEDMEESILQFNQITGNSEWAIAMKYLIHFKWNLHVRKLLYQHWTMRYVDSLIIRNS